MWSYSCHRLWDIGYRTKKNGSFMSKMLKFWFRQCPGGKKTFKQKSNDQPWPEVNWYRWTDWQTQHPTR